MSLACLASFLRSALLKDGARTANVRADATCNSLRSCNNTACSPPHVSINAFNSRALTYASCGGRKNGRSCDAKMRLGRFDRRNKLLFGFGEGEERT